MSGNIAIMRKTLYIGKLGRNSCHIIGIYAQSSGQITYCIETPREYLLFIQSRIFRRSLFG